jgi:CubicO group peptidase (beta-lactamase class C family)
MKQSNSSIYTKRSFLLHSKALSSLCFSIMLLIGCQSKKDQETKLPESFSYSLPSPTPISSDSMIRYNGVCNYWFDSFLKNSKFNGGMIVAKNGTVVFEKYQGTGHLNTTDTVNENTPFHIASVSKTFTAMAVLKLWQDKKINIDDELSKYFPDFNYSGVTIRCLLNHRSGLPNYVYFMDESGWDRKQYATNQDIYNYLTSKKNILKNIGQPNKYFSYCNTNYALLALLIEKVTGNSYPEHLKKTIFEPLQMKNSFVFTSADSSKTTPSYDWRGYQAAFMDMDKVYGDKNIFSTPRDILKWDRLLASGQYLNKETLEAAYTPYSHERGGIRNYGLGWRMYAFPDGYKIIYHNGWWHGNNASFIRLPKEDATIIVLGNKYNRSIYKAKYLIGLFSIKNAGNEEEE